MIQEKSTLILTGVVVFVVLVAAGGVFGWQSSVMKKERAKLQEQLDSLTEQLVGAEKINNELQQEIVRLTDRLAALEIEEQERKKAEEVKEAGGSVRVVSPNGGEELCLDQDATIEWQSSNLTAVSVYLVKYGGTSSTYYPLGSYPASYSETGEPGKGLAVWEVGQSSKGIKVPEGYSYKVMIMGVEGPQVSDLSDGLFSIIDCRG